MKQTVVATRSLTFGRADEKPEAIRTSRLPAYRSAFTRSRDAIRSRHFAASTTTYHLHFHVNPIENTSGDVRVDVLALATLETHTRTYARPDNRLRHAAVTACSQHQSCWSSAVHTSSLATRNSPTAVVWLPHKRLPRCCHCLQFI
jgi:hypothetical protein